jgi:hypothetical protein
MRPVEFFMPSLKKKGEFDPVCNAWFCKTCGETVLDKTPRERGEFAKLVAAWKGEA